MRRLLFLALALPFLAAWFPGPTRIPAEEVRRTMIALSFDDGPTPHTSRILDVLERYDARATFFVLPSRMMAHRDIVERAFDMGNEIANHSWSHARLTEISDAEVKNEIQRASAAIHSVTGHTLPMYRPPFGQTDDRVISISRELGYAIIKWTVDPLDWRYRDADIIYNSIINAVQDGSIILAHDTHPTTALAMERLIPRLINEGFHLVTVSELIHHLYGDLKPGHVYGSYTILD